MCLMNSTFKIAMMTEYLQISLSTSGVVNIVCFLRSNRSCGGRELDCQIGTAMQSPVDAGLKQHKGTLKNGHTEIATFLTSNTFGK